MVLETFDANGSKYEIRLSSNGAEFEIRAFNASGPANGYSYHVTLSLQHDLKILAKQDMVKELTRIAKEDVLQQRYEKLLDALSQS